MGSSPTFGSKIMQTRLSRTTEKKTKKQLTLSLLGIVVLLFILFRFGIPALTSLSLFLSSRSNNGTQVDTTNPNAVVSAPQLSQNFSATNSASITIDGTAQQGETVTLYLNGSTAGSIQTKNDGTFSFSGVSLTQQQNTIQAKATLNNKTSDYSDTWNVEYIQKAPSLSVDSPHDGDSFDSSHPMVVVSGKTDPDVKVTVNGFWAIVDSVGNYSYTLSLQNGDNYISVVATDAAGNTATKNLTIHHSQ